MPKQAELLERLRVRWQRPLTASEARWAVCFAHLVAFARRHGHCQVLDITVLYIKPSGQPQASSSMRHLQCRQRSDGAQRTSRLWC
jgi:hypothetical protein